MTDHDIERYQKIHVWIGTNFAPEADYQRYFELDHSVHLDDPDYTVCGFCQDIGVPWYDEDFIGIIPRRAEPVDLDDMLEDSAVDRADRPKLKAACVKLGITRANAMFWYSDGGTVVSTPLKPSYNGLQYLGLFEGE
ncbi:immunity 22 family protein [Pseudomonas sp.]|uniref:immunity 22 family protein n=1 Tax=Pseudomonas sp. TaxID=306 RepID=UPI0028A9E7B1|nr:immunity 22 family protein [Pseudomonas sp.]